MTGINPKLAALAVKIDQWRVEFRRVLDALAVAELSGDKAALEEAHKAELTAGEFDAEINERFSKIAATNLDELKLKACYAIDGEVDEPIAMSIVRDLRALARMTKRTA